MDQEGLFITFEGGEGAGKTTLIQSIEKKLKEMSRSVLVTREPGGTKLGEKIRELLLETGGKMSPHAELSLFLASRAQHVQEVILPALKHKKVVLCDRFNDSSIAYQGFARGLGGEEVTKICHFMSQGLIPDKTFYLDLDPQVGLDRAMSSREKKDRIESEKLFFHEKVRHGFYLIEKQEPERFKTIDGSQTPEKVFEEAMQTLAPLL